MRTFILFSFLVFSFSLQLPAQKGQPAFGKVEAADFLITDCDFDKGADAFVLIDYGSTYYDRGIPGFSLFKTVFERRTRIKILKEKGLSHANVEIPFYNLFDEEKIINLKARTYNIDANGQVKTTEVKKNSIYTKTTGAGYAKKIIAFPQVKVGSIIEYRYFIEGKTQANLRNWFFQATIPVLYSEYELKIPQIFRFTVKKSVIDTMEEKNEVIDELLSGADGIVATKSIKNNYIMRKLQGIKEEPFMSSPTDYMQRIEFQLNQIYYNDTKIADISLKWKDVIENILNDENFGLQLQKKIKTTDEFLSKANKIADDEERMKFIFYSIRNSIAWNEAYGIFTENGIAKTWELKTGNAADLNLLLIKLLKDASIKATPVLGSTRENGITLSNYPSVNQFNTVLSSVTIGNKNFVLDASDKICSYKLIPYKIVNTKVLILQGENAVWKELTAEKNKFKITVAVKGEIEQPGNMKGTAQVDFYDYAGILKLEEWQHDSQKFKNDYFNQPNPGFKIEDISATNISADSLPFEQKIKFSTVLNGTGEFRYFKVNLFSGITKNPFVEENRLSDIDFAVPQDYLIFGNFTIPPGFVFDGIPENISMTTSDNSIVFNRTMQVESNLLNVRITIEFRKPIYAAGFYPEFKEFYKKMIDKLNEQVVIKKK